MRHWILLFVLALVFAGCGKEEAKTAEEGKGGGSSAGAPVSDAEIQAACDNMTRIMAEQSPKAAEREKKRCPGAVKKTPADKLRPFVECLKNAKDEETLAKNCMKLQR